MSSSWPDFLTQTTSFQADSQCFASPLDDIRLASTETVTVPLTHLGLIRASGEDAATLLHNLLSSNIEALKPDEAVRSSLNTPKGRMLADFLVWRDGGDVLLQLAAELAPAIARKLSMFVLRAKAKLVDASEEVAAIGLAGPRLAEVLETLGLALPEQAMQTRDDEGIRVVRLDEQRVMLIAASAAAPELWRKLIAAGACAAGPLAWRLLDIRAGIPQITAATQEEFVAQMINFELIGGVNFRKGCYTGQEIIARMQYRGTLKKRMYRARIDAEAPAPGSDVFASDFGDQPAGKIVSSAPSPEGGCEVLVCVQIASHDAGGVRLAGGEPLAFEELPYPLA
ncbi:YgfZ/GcvT domain-containing protein [Niveibacterium terrae]|uniref:CAF17-like 4Fe-4S cluster assembly/insertion protein YgfZ n=1 Tax=Niveibacterium terrae TaxID=3373598 RepID=UPI003A901D41